ncbi:MAG: TIGR03557 family F420-dependent LLM class oxidoreductase [Dehalococcoidia bacterium]
MISVGYNLSSEEHSAPDLVRSAVRAEQAGFGFAAISDHYHPWTDAQGESSFVWSVLGSIAEATGSLQFGTAVTCPIIRTHPAILAQAAATVTTLAPGRFFFGVGSGENLNEHVLGDRWPTVSERHEMLREAIEVIRLLWSGGEQSVRGRHYTVELARIYSLPERPPPLFVAAGGPRAASIAAELADGLIATTTDDAVIGRFRRAAPAAPRVGGIKVCWAPTVEEARRTVREWWPVRALGGLTGLELRRPSDFQAAAAGLDDDDIVAGIACSPDASEHLALIREFEAAGYDHLYVRQIGPNQEGFFDFYEREVLPELELGTPRLGERVGASTSSRTHHGAHGIPLEG